MIQTIMIMKLKFDMRYKKSIAEHINIKNEFTATIHAYIRAWERLKWQPRVLDKMMAKAFNKGYKHSDTKGILKKHITKLWHRYKFVNNIRIYGENIFFFKDKRLITLYRLESKLIKYLQFLNHENKNHVSKS